MLSSSFLEMRKRNATSILQSIRQQPGSSRADVSRNCDLAKSTVSSIVDELVQKSILQETGSYASSRGRRPVGLVFNPGARVSIGISLDDDRIEMAMSDLDGSGQAVRRKKYARKLDINSIVLLVLSELQELLKTQNKVAADVAGLGLAVPGPVSTTLICHLNGQVLDLQCLNRRLSEVIPCQILIDSNTNMLAISESRLGAAQSSKMAFIVRLGRDVRSAFIIDRRLIHGNQGLAGDFGHIGIPGLDMNCTCGKSGCINTLAGMDVIVRRCQSSKSTVKEIDDVISAAAAGDVVCRRALSEAGTAIAYGLASAINIVAPSDVIVTGKLVAAGDFLTIPLRTALGRYVSSSNLNGCNLLFRDYQKHTEAIGASLAPLYQDDFWMRLIMVESEIETKEPQRV